MRYTQPQAGPARLDPSNPLTAGIFAATLPHSRRELVTGQSFVQEGNYATSVSRFGRGLATDGSASDIYVPIPAVSLTSFSLFGAFVSNSNGTDVRALALGSSSNSFPIVQIGAGTSSAAKVRTWSRDDAGVTPPASVESTASAFDGTPHTVCITGDGATLSCYIDGVFDSSTPWTNGTITVDRFAVGALNRGTTAAYWAGSTFVGLAYKRTLAVSDVRALHANPWQLFAKTSRIFAAAAGGGASAALTGVTGTGAAGTAGPANSLPLTGTAATGAVGTAVAGQSKAITGNAGTGSVGSIALSTVIALTGVAATGSVGTVTTSAGATAALTGSAGTGSPGTVSAGVSVALTGASAAGAAGTLSAGASKALSGNAATASVGTLLPAFSVALTGANATGSVGTIAVSGAPITVALSGVVATCAVGSLTASGGIAGSTGAVIYIPVRVVSGRYATNLTSRQVGQKSWIPMISVPFLDASGCISLPWYQHLRDLGERKLGGANFATLPAVADYVTVGQVDALINNALLVSITQQANTNAQALSAAVEVVQAAALPGATQIPKVQVTNAREP